MNCAENILGKLRSLRESKGFWVIDRTTSKTEGDSEKYLVADKEAVEKKISDLVDAGSDLDSIEVVIAEDADEEVQDTNQAYEEFKKACTSNATWKKANAICEKYGYRFSEENCVDVYPSGKKVPSVSIKVDYTKEYNPEVYYYTGKFGSDDPSMEIQTTAYGSLTLEKHAKYLEAVTNAHKMVEELSKLDFKELYEYPVER